MADVSSNLTKQIALFTVIFFICLGGYWSMRPIKVGIFVTVVGLDREPLAKMGTLVVVLSLIMIYNFLVQHLPAIKV